VIDSIPSPDSFNDSRILFSIELPPNSMETQVLSPSLKDIVDRILLSRRITRLDQRLLLSLANLSRDEQALLNEVFDRLRKGLLRVVD
jgi:hypothetical protein